MPMKTQTSQARTLDTEYSLNVLVLGTTIGSETSNLAVPEVEKRTHHIIFLGGNTAILI